MGLHFFLPLADGAEHVSMWQLGAPWYEFVARGAIIYSFLLVILRITGKRQVGQLAPFDLILLLVLSNAVQNAMIGQDTSVLGGMITASTLIAVNYAVSFATFRSKRLAALIEGRPIVLIHNGVIKHQNMRKVKLTMHELNAALRAEGVGCPDHVLAAVLENTGRISVVQKTENGHAGAPAGHAGPLPAPPAVTAAR